MNLNFEMFNEILHLTDFLEKFKFFERVKNQKMFWKYPKMLKKNQILIFEQTVKKTHS